MLTTKQFSILHIIKNAQQKHGLRQGNYIRYRAYCTRRIRRLRKSLKFTNLHKSFPKRQSKFTFRPITTEVATEPRFFEILIFETERNWAYAMHLKIEISDNIHHRKKYQMRQRMRRAVKCSTALYRLANNCSKLFECCEGNLINDETKAYNAYLKATLCIEFQRWKKALELFTLARKIFKNLRESSFASRCDDLIRLCRFHCGESDDVFSVQNEETLDLDFNKISIELQKENNVNLEENKLNVKKLQLIPCKPMFFDIAMNYRKKNSKLT